MSTKPALIFDTSTHQKSLGKAMKLAFSHENLLLMAVAYISGDPRELLGLGSRRNLALSLICDIGSGNCNPYVLRKLVNGTDFHVRTYRNLHAKVTISKSCVAVSSANLSAHALVDGNVESAAIFRDRSSITAAHRWFDQLWKQSDDITERLKEPKYFRKLVDIWNVRQRSPKQRKPTLLEILQQHPKFLNDYVFGLYVAATTDVSDSDISSALRRKGILLNKPWDRYEENDNQEAKDVYDKLFKRERKKLIMFRVTTKGTQVKSFGHLVPHAFEFVDYFVLKRQLQTIFLPVISPFTMNGKSARTLCKLLNHSIAERPAIAEKIWNKPGKVMSVKEFTQILV